MYIRLIHEHSLYHATSLHVWLVLPPKSKHHVGNTYSILICRHSCSSSNSLLLKNYQSFFSLRITSPLESTSQVLTYFVSNVLICLFLIHLFSTIISPHQYHHHHSYHPSSYHSSFPTWKLFFFSNFTFHRHLTPLQTDFMDIRTALRFFLRFSSFSSFSYRYFLLFSFLSQASYLFHNHLFLDFLIFFYFFQFYLKHC